MSIQGNLDTMSLQSLLRWVLDQSATGVLELERNKVAKRIAFREGRVIGCSSDDPPSRIGQFLLARGKISEEALALALDAQSRTEASLGAILQDMGVIEAEELDYELGAKAEETIFSLFDWEQAVFRFKSGEPEDPWMIDVHMDVDEIIERGTQRRTQLDTIRRLFVSSGVVLERGEEHVPPEVMGNGLASGILATIDGARTVGEVLYHARASEFLVLKFLASAVHSGLVRIVAVRGVDAQQLTLLDDHKTPACVADHDRTSPAPSSPAPAAPAPEAAFDEQCDLAQHLLAQDEFEAALDVLDDCYEACPGDEFLSRLMRKAESAFIQGCREGDLKGNYVPSRVPGKTMNLDETPFSSAERFLLGMMGEEHSIQTLLWVAPMRDVDVYRALALMSKAGVIELRDSGDGGLEGTAAPTVEWA